MADKQAYLGSGMFYPLTMENGRAKIATGVTLVKQDMERALDRQKGTRFFLGEFGSFTEDVMFEPNDDVLETLMEQFIAETLQRWVKRVRFISATFEHDLGTNGERVDATIKVKILQSNEVESFIYPFYKELTT